MYSLKRGVSIFVSPEIEKMLSVLSLVYRAFRIPVVITSGLDGPHREGSLHYRFRAFDIRKNFPAREDALTWDMHHVNILDAVETQFSLRKYPVLIIEEADHLHIEWCAE